MKLNYRKTILVGMAFFLISAFWQAYDAIIPKILIDHFGLSQTVSGAIMALDNVLALFMLPLFGSLSDKTKSRFGRRTPYIVAGTVVAAVLFMSLTFADNMQLTRLDAVNPRSETALETLYEYEYQNTLKTPDGVEYSIQETFTKEDFAAIETGSKEYTDYVVPARQAFAWQQTVDNPTTLVFFIALLFFVLLAMGTFRSPAVALMPDVTVRPLRSKGNAVINLCGAVGGVSVLVLGIVFGTGSVLNATMSYTTYFIIIAAIMLVALLVFMCTVREPKLVAEMHAESARLGITEEDDNKEGDRRMSRAEFISLLLILGSVALWYMGYNAVTSKYSVYATQVLGLDFNTTLLIASAAAIVAYLPAGMLASRIGRRKTILIGVVLLAGAFTAAAFMRAGSPVLVMNVLFALAGIGWATINVNSYPMVVELATGSQVGKYTGYYYTASMAAQIITPVFSGVFLDNVGMTSLFPYAAIFVALAFVTMFFVRHGDSRPDAKKGLEALDIDD